MTIIVDPETRILSEDQRVFVLHPGDGKRFYRDFIESNAVFLDLPGISFDTPPDINDTTIRNRLRMARRISIWRRRGSAKSDEPSRDPSDYAIKSQSTETPRFVHEVEELYVDAKAGDLILIPGKGYNSTVYFGEFEHDFDPGFTVESIRYPGERIPARRVKWLNVHKAKGQFNRRLIRLMQNRQAIIQITRREDKIDVYENAYGDYVWGEISGNLIKVTKEIIDLNDLSKAVNLTNYFASQYIALKKGELKQFLELDFHSAIDVYYDRNYFGGVSVEIHSPGYFGRPMKDALLASYVSAMLALSAAGVSAQEAMDVKVTNSANAVTSICDAQLEKDIRESMEMYANIHLWEDEICPRRADTQSSVGLKTQVTVKRDRLKAQN